MMQVIWNRFENDPDPIIIDTGNISYIFSVNPLNNQLDIINKISFEMLSLSQRNREGFYKMTSKQNTIFIQNPKDFINQLLSVDW